jgi:hypothetical protein
LFRRHLTILRKPRFNIRLGVVYVNKAQLSALNTSEWRGKTR